MSTFHKCSIFMLCLGLALAVRTTTRSSPMSCEYYNETACKNSRYSVGCNGTEDCKSLSPDKGNQCYILWQKGPEGFNIKLKGCWVGNRHDCTAGSTCTETQKDPNIKLLFCCCEGDMCNNNMIRTDPPEVLTSEATVSFSTSVPLSVPGNHVLNTFLYTLVPLLGITLVLIVAYWVYRHHKMAYFNEVPTIDPSPLPPPSPPLGLKPVQLLEVKAQGRFGAVWKAQMLNEFVAVKIHPPQDKNSWQVEKEIFQLPQMKHDNILSFIAAEKRGDTFQLEYWLITAYHEKGSLSDYLKANVVSWSEVLSITDSISRGLMHLHEELPPTRLEAYKPSIAHRDFKSKNVLLKNNMIACIADFGLALVFLAGQSPGDTHGQVGTRRYMAPEVLEGAISFNRDAFLRIDMYACGLVLWELLSRCSAQDGPIGEYMLPFEEEVGQHPTLEDMQETVVQKKARPKFKNMWKKHPGMAALCSTIEECWDHDAEARLSASCVQERITLLYKSVALDMGSEFLTTTDLKNPTTTSEKLPALACSQLVPYSKEPSLLPPIDPVVPFSNNKVM
ncbi:activin receptor type-2A-like [Limulus polyphemus]|uniref:Serine/threonine-protein kinase receptor n=1 Tax=Limulus polyphemus TaxID=6850 RepID=A0ABM1TLG6_LIMPO|nr:activin receptor type-2A-like [Limulus polyphemus]XP_022256723.1 activin receptor type-2A-like [Limulus polyphemus]